MRIVSIYNPRMFLEVSQLQVHYPGRAQAAVQNASLGLRAGDIGVLIGPSGCGKTTLLRAVAGLESASGGHIRLGGAMVSSAHGSVPAQERRIGMVFQDYALFPHLDVARNVGFGIHQLPAAELAQRHPCTECASTISRCSLKSASSMCSTPVATPPLYRA